MPPADIRPPSPAAPAAPAPTLAAPPAGRELTGRALAAGLGAGLLLAVANLVMGLKTGWWDSGHVTASVLAFALASAVGRGGRAGRAGALELAHAQAAATAVGAAPATLGLLGAVPALALLGHRPPAWAVAALGLALAALGVLGALGLRRRLLEEERLPFPSGVAAAEVVRALEGDAGRWPTRALAAALVAAAAVTALRDAAGLLPAALPLPVLVAGLPASAWTLGLAVNPMLAGAGLVVGLRAGLSVLAGGAIAFGLLGPRLVAAGVVAEAGYGPLVAWLAWPGVGLVLGAGVVSLGGERRAFAAALRDLRGIGAGARARARPAVALGAALAGAAALAALAVAVGGFGVSPVQAAAALALAALLALVCVRAAGQTDIMPAGEMAQISQAALGAAGTGGAAANVAAGGLAAGASAQATVALWSFRAGQLLGARPDLQARAMAAGALAGAGVALPLYAVLDRAYGVGSAALPAPAAVPFRAVAELVTGGGAALPPGALAAATAAFALGAALELLGRRTRLAPSASALGMGFIAPALFGAAIAAGALAGVAWRRLHPGSAAELAPAVGAGAIAGESLTAAAVAVALALAR